MIVCLLNILCLFISSSYDLLHCHLLLCSIFGETIGRRVDFKLNLILSVFNLLTTLSVSHHHSQKALEPPILLAKVVSVLCLFVWLVHPVNVCVYPPCVHQYLFLMQHSKFASSGVFCLCLHVPLPPRFPPLPPCKPPPPPLLESKLRELMLRWVSRSKCISST